MKKKRRLRQKLSIDVRRKIPGSSKKKNFLGQFNTDYDFAKIKNNLQTQTNEWLEERASSFAPQGPTQSRRHDREARARLQRALKNTRLTHTTKTSSCTPSKSSMSVNNIKALGAASYIHKNQC